MWMNGNWPSFKKIIVMSCTTSIRSSSSKKNRVAPPSFDLPQAVVIDLTDEEEDTEEVENTEGSDNSENSIDSDGPKYH